MSATPQARFASNPTTVRAQATKIAVDPKGEKLIYTQNRTVIIRSLLDPAQPAVAYSQHAHPATVARISPSGFYCASADQSGTVRVWDLLGDEQILKSETRAIAGRIKDLAWDGESKRIIAVGESRDKFGHAFSFDSGSSVGEIAGHSRAINAVAIRKDRPFRAVTAGDDSKLVFLHGAPYKYNKAIEVHTRFAQDVSFAPSGEHFVSVASDGKIFVFDGKTGDQVSELSASGEGHTGTIYAVDFAPDSKRIATAGADGFVKVWDVASGKVLESFDFNGRSGGAKGDDHQVGITWAGNDKVVSLSNSGELYVIQGGKITTLHGACKSFGVDSLAVAEDGQTLVAGVVDGRVLSWSPDGVCTPVSGSRHTNAVVGLGSVGSKGLVSIGIDDTVRCIASGQFQGSAIATSGQPKSAASSPSGITVVAVPTGVDVIGDGAPSKVHHAVSYTPTAVAVSDDGKLFAVGSQESKVYLYSWDGSKASEMAKFENNRSAISALAFDPKASLLAAGESSGKVLVYDIAAKALKLNQWVFHSGRINSIRFSPDGTHAVSGSLDTHVYVWSVNKPMKNISVKNAHAGGVNGVVWLGNDQVASAGADGCIRTFSIKRHDGA